MKYTMIFILAFLLSCTKNFEENYLPIVGNEVVKIDVKESFGAVGNGVSDDWEPLQRAIDSAVQTNGRVYIPKGRYRISKPLMVYNWYGGEYKNATCEIEGDDNMWSGGISVIISDYKDGFALGIQRGKGVIVKGLYFQGKYNWPNLPFDSLYRTTLDNFKDTTHRDTRYSPSAAIVIDPFSGNIPADGGYPQMATWYRGPQTRSGSTGCRFEDISTFNHNIGFITSPNGFTQNAEIMTFENIRVIDTRIGFVGCQAQEKLNRVINLGAWGRTHTLFVWNKYGFMQPGHWVIDGVNVAGQVVNLVHRSSGSFFPLHMKNVFAESLGSIGWWGSGCGDAMDNSSINFVYPDQVKQYSIEQLSGITFNNCNIRYYGQFNTPVVFGKQSFDLTFQNTKFYTPVVFGKLPAIQDSVDMGGYFLRLIGFSHPGYFVRDGREIVVAPWRSGKYVPLAGDQVIIVNMSDHTIWGQCKVRTGGEAPILDYISAHQPDRSYYYYVYKKK